MKLFVNTIEFGIIELLVRNDENIKEIKENIYGKIGLNENLLNLYFNGEILEDDKTLNKYEIINNSVINIVNKLRGGMRIFVENNEKIFAFEIEENEKIINAKLKISESLRIDDNYYYLIYNDKIFDGDESLIEFGILNKSLINVVRNNLHIFAKTKNGQTYVIEVVYSENIIDLKRKIQEQIGLHPDKQKLIYLTNLLDDDKTIDEYQIFDQSVINIVDRLEDEMQIFAKTIDGRTIIFEVQKSDKIIDIKYKIQDKIGLSTDLQQLIYQDKILSDDDKTIDQYQIVDKSVINIIAKLNFIQIFAKTMDGETVKFKTCESEKIIDLKKKIEEKLKFHRNRQILIYNCIILEDDKTIDQYQIHDNSVIDIINKSKIKIIINLEIFDGRKFKLCAEKQTKIIDIKKQIEMLIDLDPTKQNLYYQDVLLEGNEDTLEDIQASLKGASHTINKKMPFMKRLFKPKKLQPSKDVMTIYVELSNDWLEIFVETANQIQYKLCVKKYETILDVKNKIHQVVNVEPNEQILLYNKSILENNKTVEQSNIVDKSVLLVQFNLKNKYTITCSTDEYEKIGNIKKIIREKNHINEEQKIILFSSTFRDNKVIFQFEIKDKEQTKR